MYSRLRTLVALLSLLVLGACGSADGETPGRIIDPDQPPPGPEVQRVRLDDVVDQVARYVASGQALSTHENLAAVVDEVLTVEGVRSGDVSSEAVIAEVVRRAEAHERGQGRRVLAYLFRETEAEFGAVAADPAFGELRTLASHVSPEDMDPARFVFAGAEEAASVRLRPSMERAVRQLAEVYAPPNLMELRALAVTHFQRPGFSFDRVVAGSSDTREAIVRLFEEGTPPPRPEAAAEAIMRETVSANGALREHRAFLGAIYELQSELGLDQLDPELRRYVNAAGSLPTRRAQVAEAARFGRAGEIARAGDDGLIRAYRAGFGAGDANTAARSRSAQQYSDYMFVSFEPPEGFADGDAAGGGPRPGPGGGSGSGSGGGAGSGPGGRGGTSRPPPRYNADRTYRAARPSAAYAADAVDILGTAAPLSRTFAAAIGSARAARGIAAGATVTSGITATPTAAAWLANREDGRFGRLVVQLQPRGGGPPFLAVSRTLFADSFYPAVSVIWGGHRGTTAFREGEMLVLMSMDPFSHPDPEGRADLERRAVELERRLASGAEDEGELQTSMAEFEEDLMLFSATRRVVLHPALFGRELAWSAPRIDFSFNDVEGLSREAAMMNGGSGMPAGLAGINLEGASTWQFFERDARVQFAPGAGTVGLLSVASAGPVRSPASIRSHFAISMFGEGVEGASEDELPRLLDMEAALQPMLDWLATNHHDFMRLNDFSEALSLIRWLQGERVAPILIDMDGEDPEIATPDRIVIGDGPRVGA